MWARGSRRHFIEAMRGSAMPCRRVAAAPCTRAGGSAARLMSTSSTSGEQPTKVCLIVGASRGIGAAIAENLGAAGLNLALCSKSTDAMRESSPETKRLRGTVDDVARAVRRARGDDCPDADKGVIAFGCNVREPDDVEAAVARTVERFGRLDALVYNAGAIWWDKVVNTSAKRVDLLHEVNYRGCFVAASAALPVMERNGDLGGHLVFVAPPIYSRFIRGKTAYAASKVSMSVLAIGLAHEHGESAIRVNCLWPATAIESEVTKKLGVPPAAMRNASIFSDAVRELISLEPHEAPNGETLIDEDFLRTRGWSDDDMVQYRCDPDAEPPRMMPAQLPSLRVAEEDDAALPSPVGASSAAAAGLTKQRKSKL